MYRGAPPHAVCAVCEERENTCGICLGTLGHADEPPCTADATALLSTTVQSDGSVKIDIETGDAGEDTFNHDEIKNEWRAFAGENEAQMKKFVEEIQNANHDEALTTQQQIAKFKAERDRKREFGWRGILNTALIISLIGIMLGAACTWWANRFESNARMYLALSCLSTLGWLLVLLGLTLASTVSAAPDSTAIDFDKFAQVRPTRVQTAHSLVVC